VTTAPPSVAAPSRAAAGAPLLEARDVTLRYGAHEVLHGLSLRIDPGELTALIGPNGSGKSTLLRVLARLLAPQAGVVHYREQAIASIAPREFARALAYLPQAPEGPGDLTIEELAWRGRYPHRGLFAGTRAEDRAAVEHALEQAGVVELRDRALATLSGGERQRAWIAMALAREPEVLLLDEPTTFLDIGHQGELLRLLGELNRERGLTVVMVLHDVTQAAHHARRVIALREGRILHDGPPAEVVTAERIGALFDAPVTVLSDPETGAPVVIPRTVARG